MYLRKVCLKYTGPIEEITLDLPFEEDRPKPLVLVGPNGSGKSTLISFIVNALIGLRQFVYDDIEVEKGKVYRLRSPLGINGNAEYYFARLDFDKGVSLIEWQLNKQKKEYGNHDIYEQIDESWKKIPDHEITYIDLKRGELSQIHVIEDVLERSSLLFFPADRFEPPDWLNSENLSSELRLPEVLRIKGQTERRFLSKNRLKPTLEWLNAVIFDVMVCEYKSVTIQVNGNARQVRTAAPGRAHDVFNSAISVLTKILAKEDGDIIQLGIGDRKGRVINATIRRNGEIIRHIKDLLSMSAGESSLFLPVFVDNHGCR